MLLVQKAYVEGSLALCMYGSLLVDHLHAKEHLAPQERDDMALLLDTLTPLIKSWPSEWALEANKWAIQIHGGYGFTRDYAVEQFYRDNRLNMIHEGTNGIQSLDLLGRKVTAKDGKGLKVLLSEIRKACTEAARAVAAAPGHAPLLGQHAGELQAAVDRLYMTTRLLADAGAVVRPRAHARVWPLAVSKSSCFPSQQAGGRLVGRAAGSGGRGGSRVGHAVASRGRGGCGASDNAACDSCHGSCERGLRVDRAVGA
jgi:hypothetical protein